MSDPRLHRNIAALGALAVLWGLSGCAAPGGKLNARLEHRAPEFRIRAIQEVVRKERRDLLPGLVSRLDDDDPAVRLYAILGLERLTGTRLGYSYHDPPNARRASIQAWHDWLAEQPSE